MAGGAGRGLRAVGHARENAKREKPLGKVARRPRRSDRGLWRYIAALDVALAWRVASARVAWAVAAGVAVPVLEHLRPYRPVRGLSWTRRPTASAATGCRPDRQVLTPLFVTMRP